MGRRLLAGGGACAALVVAVAAWAGTAAAFPTSGTQTLLVVPVEYAHAGCPPDAAATPTCPRSTAAQLRTILQNGLTAYYGNPATGSRVTWRVRVLADPDTATGWWPAPSTVQQLSTRAAATGANWNAFTASGSPVRDAAELVVAKALKRGVISAAELGASTRLVAVHNWHVAGGQSAGNVPLRYTASYGRGRAKTYSVTAAFVNEGADDGELVRVLEHELGHELAPRDLFGSPCPLWPPGEPPPLPFGNDLERVLRTECVADWDLMGLTGPANPAPSFYTRTILGWVPTVPPTVRYEPGVFTGEFELSSLEHPNGQPLALHIPDDPNRVVLDGTFGNTTDFQGYLAECRRTAWNDVAAPPGQGLLISYVNGARTPQDRQLVVVRPTSEQPALEDTDQAVLRTGETFVSHSGGFSIRFNGFTSTGGCIVLLDRPTVILDTASFIPAVNQQEALFAPDLGGTTPKAVWANPGVVLNGATPPVAPARRGALARAVHVHAPARGTASTIRFVYGNAGGRSGTGTAVVRVQQPWAATAACGAPDGPRGRIVGVLDLPRLAAGAARVGKTTWHPRSSAPAGVTVTFRGSTRPFSEAESASTVLSFTTSRARVVRIPLTLAAGDACKGRVPYMVTPAIMPAGWRATVEGAQKALRRGRPVHVTVVVHRPAGNTPAATDIPVTISFGSSKVDTPLPAEGEGALGAVPMPGFVQTVGIDLLVRAAPRGTRLPGFTIPQAARIRKTILYPPPGLVPGPAFHQTLAITECTQATGTGGQSVFVRGAPTPLRAGVVMHLTYTSVGGVLPPGTVVERSTISFFPTGLFADTFPRQGSSWIVVGRLDEDELYSGAESTACAIPAP